MPGFISFSYYSTSGQNIKPPATLFKIKVEVKVTPVAKSKILCHICKIKKP